MAALSFGCGKSSSSGSRPTRPVCNGSGLAGDPFNTTSCATPPTPTDDCLPGSVSSTPTLFPTAATSTTTPSTFEAEASAAVDRASTEKWSYIATQETVLGPTGGTPGSCIIEKTVKVYRSRNGGNWELLAGLPTPTALGGTNPANPTGIWVTDPWLNVGPDGTLFLSVFADQGTADCTTGAPVEANDRLSEVELFTMPRNGTTLTQVATTTGANCGPTGTCSAISVGTNSSASGGASLDHPRMAVSPTDPNLVVVTWLGVTSADHVRTLRKDAMGVWSVSPSALTNLPFGTFSFANPTFAPDGDLFIAHTPPGGVVNPIVHHFRLDTMTNDWTSIAIGGPTPDAAVVNTSTTNFTGAGVSIPIDPTAAIKVVNFPQNADPIVYVAYTVDNDFAAGAPFAPSVRLSAVNANGLADTTKWLPPVTISRAPPIAAWAQALDVDPAANVLDLLYNTLDDAPGLPPGPGSRLNTYLERRRANDITSVLLSATEVTTGNGPLVSDLPARGAGSGRVFPGEYVALASNGDTSIVGFPFTSATPPTTGIGATNNIDFNVGGVQTLCAAMRTLSLGAGAFLPDNVWECDCDCGGVTSNVVGCAAGPLDVAGACEQVCVESDCGEAASCPTLRECVSTGVGRRKFTDGCALESGPSIGSNPSLFADFFASDDGSSHATFHFSGDSASTKLTGSISVNVPDGAPAAGGPIEISRLQLSPHSFDVGGFLGARVRDLTVTHIKRLRGVFLDATHFTVPANAADLLTQFTIDPDGPSWLTGDSTTERRASFNGSPITGTLDIATSTLTLSLTVGSGGDDMTATFSGHLSAAPVDSDGDGVVDPLDNCPDVPNPTQVDDPPVIASVSETEIEQCTPSSVLHFPVPAATDVCTPDEVTIEGSVTAINGVVQSPPIFLDGYSGTFPSTYPSGSIVVEWTATDGNGHTSSVTQTFQLRSDHTGPVFDVVPPDFTSSKCTGVSLGQASATDSCGGSVTFSTNAPSKFGLGPTTVTWTATDARGNKRTATQKVTTLLANDSACCPAGTNVIVGTSNNNVLTGTSGSDCILGLGGQDTLNGNGGDDYLSGGDGNDTLNGGDGNDKLFGGSGQDTLNGNNGSDSMYGGDGDDLLVGGIGDDLLRGGQGQDTLQGQDGNDQLFGDTGHDNLQGGNGDDTLGGDAGGAICDGGSGTNVFEQCDAGAPNSCADAAKNGSESAVDCGGGCQLGCDVGLACASGGDCLGNVCSGGLCQSLPGGIAVKLIVDSDFGSGYCVHLSVTNAADDPTTDWTASFNTNQSTIYSSWGGTFSATSGAITVTLPEEPVLDAAETDGSTGFCANRSVPSSGSLPFVLSGTGSY
ncbi:MAG TPA: cellulose binding domain-containing protein [Polyangiaceae bacterium]|nr:cellulose binding domain-containing protein [Polyangiaceae bacterium]